MSWVMVVSAFWLGILTSISPCPLATNIAAISFIARKSGNTRHILSSGVLYAAGRILAYVLLGAVITAGVLGSASVAQFLQKYMTDLIGPILILLGLILLGWIGSTASLSFGTEKLSEKVGKGGIIWAFPIGILFAISFCPVSAGLFFGGLLPVCVKSNSIIILPVVYGLGTALPVVFFAFLMAFASSYVSKAFNRLSKIELWVRHFAGAAFLLVGIYYSVCRTFALAN